MPIKRGLENGKSYYQYGESGKKYFYITGNKSSRDKARNQAMRVSHSLEQTAIPILGGELARFNTQTPERMAEIQTKYKGQAHPDFIDRYADTVLTKSNRPSLILELITNSPTLFAQAVLQLF